MSQPDSRPTTTALSQVRILAAALIGAIVVFAIVFTPVLGTDGYPPVVVPAALGVLAVVAHFVVEAIGYRAPAVPPGTPEDEARAMGLPAFQSSLILRFALCEAVAIIAIVAAFVVEPRTVMTYLVGGTLSLLLMAWHVWPSERTVRRVEQQLDRDGGTSRLWDTLTGNLDTGAVRS